MVFRSLLLTASLSLSGTCVVRILPRIDTKGLTPDDVADLADRTRQTMLEETRRHTNMQPHPAFPRETPASFYSMMEVLPSRCVPIAKRELMYAGTVGLACWLAGVIFINRKKTDDAISVMSETAQTMLKEDFMLLHIKYLYGIKIDVKGWENFPLKEPYVVVSNHQSSIDLLGKTGGEGDWGERRDAEWGKRGEERGRLGEEAGGERGKGKRGREKEEREKEGGGRGKRREGEGEEGEERGRLGEEGYGEGVAPPAKISSSRMPLTGVAGLWSNAEYRLGGILDAPAYMQKKSEFVSNTDGLNFGKAPYMK
ncbi:1-acyl-sn-glycerol-3-phosphate acyltransferase alpha [Acipenser ruthenus]|uniref:1-acylglycerol-3-phosphate O-acyltransferase n=1 Tax=Acipenser ruthenus TaxID=7906 RepID=A0A444UXK6_ACIRT|nr:1-acyl-sn-glycerol-3-phosphate acyltransferase alpha [Acipenser ruthenus]